MWLAIMQGPTFGARALPRRPLGPPTEPIDERTSPEGSSRGCGTLVQRRELGRLLGWSLAIDVVAHAW
jgi:hypothetical protein